MKIIAISALALGLTAFGANAQQRDQDEAINKGTSTSTAQPGTPATGVEKPAGNPDNNNAATPSDNASSKTETAQAGKSDQPGLKVKKARRGSQARTGNSSRHQKRAAPAADLPPSSDRDSSASDPMRGDKGSMQPGSSDSVARPAAPSPTDDTRKPIDSTTTPAPKDQPNK